MAEYEPHKKRLSPDNIVCIDLTSSDDEETECLKSVRKRLKSNDITLSSTKVKTELSAQGKAKKPFVFFDDVEVVEKEIGELMCLPVSNSGSASHDDIAVVGTLNQLRLPHMRPHCTEKPFQNDLGYSLVARKAVNGEHCNSCYCYVCDVPVKDCESWKDGDHCLATDQGDRKHYWAQRRDAAKGTLHDGGSTAFTTLQAPVTATNAAALGLTNRVAQMANGGKHMGYECPKFITVMIASVTFATNHGMSATNGRTKRKIVGAMIRTMKNRSTSATVTVSRVPTMESGTKCASNDK
jgi:hypothetical protein